MPRAKPYPDNKRVAEEPSESPWDEEASTTIEQGEAERRRGGPLIKKLNTTLVTSTGAGLDDATVDDRQARSVLSELTPIPAKLHAEREARLIVTQGTDAGQEFEIRPGKTYTVGRAIDNDVVLSDIAVSRKHFDLKHEGNAWIIVDRGSGNGTIVNGNLEDNPFTLANGDHIEIGNTTFRYDQPGGASRVSDNQIFEVDDDDDDEDMSTVAGKPLREVATGSIPPLAERPRAKTMPPPPPHSTRTSSPPPLSTLVINNQQPLLPASTLPMPQMANRAPLAPMTGPGAPTVIGGPMGLPLGGVRAGPNGLPPTLPGQGPAFTARPSFPYPQAADIPPHSMHAQLLRIQSPNLRGDGSTAHVAPVPYDSMHMNMAPNAQSGLQLSKRTKLIAAAVGLAILTGIVTAAVVRSEDPPKTAAATAGRGSAKPAPAKPERKTDPEPIAKNMPTVAPPKSEPDVVKPEITPPNDEPEITPPNDEPELEPKIEPKKVEPKVESKKVEPKVEPKKIERKREVRKEPTTTKRIATADASAARDKADGLYRDRKFNDAASVLAAAAKSASDDEAKELRYKADLYSKLGKAYAQGTAPAQKPNVAYEFLQQASNYDRSLGNAFDGDLQTRLAALAPKAAVVYIGAKDFPKARSALIAAQRYGSSDSNLPLVKQKLEARAGELYNEAAKEIGSNPGPAKDKLRQVKSLVDAKSPWAVKADALLKKS